MAGSKPMLTEFGMHQRLESFFSEKSHHSKVFRQFTKSTKNGYDMVADGNCKTSIWKYGLLKPIQIQVDFYKFLFP